MVTDATLAASEQLLAAHGLQHSCFEVTPWIIQVLRLIPSFSHRRFQGLLLPVCPCGTPSFLALVMTPQLPTPVPWSLASNPPHSPCPQGPLLQGPHGQPCEAHTAGNTPSLTHTPLGWRGAFRAPFRAGPTFCLALPPHPGGSVCSPPQRDHSLPSDSVDQTGDPGRSPRLDSVHGVADVRPASIRHPTKFFLRRLFSCLSRQREQGPWCVFCLERICFPFFAMLCLGRKTKGGLSYGI